MRTIIHAGLAAVTLTLTGAALAQPEGGRKISTTLNGTSEVPGPGDSDGSGTFEGRVNPGQGQVCYKLAVSAIAPATGAHIHRGATGVAGPVVVGLTAPSAGSSEACATVSRDLAMELIQSPEAFYVNVHTAPFPAGAVRGQLGKGN